MSLVLSDEQNEILSIAKKLKPNEVLKINAFAGTGKTTTLKAITKAIDKSFLYLAFNSDIVKEAKKDFGENVLVVTLNSLAYRKIITENGYILSKQNLNPVLVSDFLQINFSDAYDVLNIYHMFCNSEYKEIEELKYKYIPKRLDSFKYAKKLYLLFKEKIYPCDHSFYLKEYELLGCGKELNYDYVLLDEAQDSNPVTLSIFKQLTGRKILVGDTHQTIYQFRGSINAMESIPSDYLCYLTNTYRCNGQIVELANTVLAKYKNEKVKLVSRAIYNNSSIVDTAYISRTNSELISLIQTLDEFNCLKSVDDIFDLSLSVHFFIEKKEINSKKYKYLEKFKNIEELIDFAEKTENIELQGAIRNAKRYKGYLFILKKKALNNHSSKSKTILTTGHSSKGLEFDKVFVCKDFKNPNKHSDKDSYTCEANLLYVVITRAKKTISFLDGGFLDEIH